MPRKSVTIQWQSYILVNMEDITNFIICSQI